MEQQNFQIQKETAQQPVEKKSKKTYLKFIFGFFGIILAVFVGYPLAKYAYESYTAKKMISNYFKWEEEYKESLKNDTFGGQTPKETYEMFVETLKKGDILEVAKYYYRDEDRISAYKRFDKMQKDGSLANWIAELPDWSKMKEVEYWDPDGKEFNYERFREKEEIIDDLLIKGEKIILPIGKYNRAIIFKISKSANIWKNL